LKYCRCICESKGDNQEFKEAIAGVYGHVREIFISYLDEVLEIKNVNLGDLFWSR
jgi:hypothetical protein